MCLVGLQLTVNVDHFREIETAIAPSLSSIDDAVRKRWFALASVIERTVQDYEDAGISGNTVTVTMDMFKGLPTVDLQEDAGMGSESDPEMVEGTGVKGKSTPSTRRSGRPSKKSEKAREVPVAKEDKGKGRKGLKDRSSSKYSTFSAGKHSYWAVPVREVSLFLLFILTCLL